MFKSLYKALTSVLLKRHFYLIRGLNFLGRKTRMPLNNLDYVRVATLELLRHEIDKHNIAGEVAELGVYKGGFAKYINRVFSDRRFYLFDTFERFSESDITKEKEIRSNYEHQDFTGTSVEQVLSLCRFQTSAW